MRETRVESHLPSDSDDAVPGGPESAGTFVVGIVGDSGSGMETVALAVRALLDPARIADVRADDYRRFSRAERTERELTALDPQVHDLALLEEHLRLLRERRPVRIRSYNHGNGTFDPARTIEPRDIVLARGSLALATDGLRDLYDLSIFLQPEPDLLFRWKFRRDILFRGYTEAQVLKHIASHLLDAKQYVIPQAEVADLLVTYQLPDWEAPDSEVVTTLTLRGRAAEVAASTCLFEGLPAPSRSEGELVITIPAEITEESVSEHAARTFPATWDPQTVGTYADEKGAKLRRPSLALVELLIARLVRDMASAAADAPAEEESSPG